MGIAEDGREDVPVELRHTLRESGRKHFTIEMEGISETIDVDCVTAGAVLRADYFEKMGDFGARRTEDTPNICPCLFWVREDLWGRRPGHV